MKSGFELRDARYGKDETGSGDTGQQISYDSMKIGIASLEPSTTENVTGTSRLVNICHT